MPSCEHTAWVKLVGEDDVYLHDCGRLARLIEELPNPSTVYPSLTLFLGNKTMRSALRDLFTRNNLKRGQGHGLAHLRVDASTVLSDAPYFFAEADPLHTTNMAEPGGQSCHQSRARAIDWYPPMGISATAVIYARLFFLFSNIVCIFADDCGGIERVADLLKLWAAIGSASSLPNVVRPRIIVVTADESASATHEVLQLEELRYRLGEQNTQLQNKCFSCVKLVTLAGSHVSSLARHRRLKEILLDERDEGRRIQTTNGALFSALHMNRFFEEAVDHTVRTMSETFNFITVARDRMPVSRHFASHVLEFISVADDMKVPSVNVFDHIASCIVVDAFPPGMHGFHAYEVFHHLYSQHLRIALDRYKLKEEAIEVWLIHVRERVQTITNKFHDPIASRHSANMVAQSAVLGSCRSNRTCLFCLVRAPEHSMSCGHTICDTCIRRFGSGIISYEQRFKLLMCQLCASASNVTANLQPPTAGIRILSIDGGGVGGVVPLEIMKMLQSCLGQAFPLQDLFDLAIGTSSGGLTVIGLFLCRWTVEYCSEIFDNLSRDLFKSRHSSPYRILSRVKVVLECLLNDGQYDVNLFEDLLKKAFGSDKRMFGSACDSSGTKVAVTAANISNAYTFLLSNYNGSESRPKECDYKHVRSSKVKDEPYIWEAGRATSAAPVFFASASIPSLGSFQDGGLRHNNPASLAVCEARQIWSSQVSPDVVLSLGTGSGEDSRSPKLSHFRNFVTDGFISRLTRLLMNSFNREGPWKELVNQVDDDKKKDYIRFNIPISPGKTVRLDDVSKMDELKASVHRQPDSHSTAKEAAWVLLLSNFYFELDAYPYFNNGLYHCRGSLKCRLNARKVFDSLARFDRDIKLVTKECSLGVLTEKDICDSCYRYRKPVTYLIRTFSDNISMMLKYGPNQRQISGGLRTVAWYIQRQGLDCVFGRDDHDNPGRMSCDVCEDKLGTDCGKRKMKQQHNSRKKARQAQ